MAIDPAETWRQCFARWPADVERRGVLVTAFGEQIPFETFAVGEDTLLIERRSPDTVGARMVIIAYQHIQAVKLVEVLKMKALQPLGFVLPPGKK